MKANSDAFLKTIFLSLLLTFPLVALDNGQASVEWQKILLEEKIQGHLQNLISTILLKNEFTVVATVKVESPELTDLASNDSEGENQNNSNSGIKFSDIPASVDGGDDLILLEKLGIAAPSYPSETQDKASPMLLQNSIKEQAELLSKFDLFKFITEVSIRIIIDEKVDNAKKDAVKKLLSELSLKFGEFQATIETKFMALDFSSEQAPIKEKVVWWEIPLKFANALGMIMAAIILSILAVTLFKRHHAFLEQRSEDGKSDNENNSQAEIDAVTALQGSSVGGPAATAGGGSGETNNSSQSFLKKESGPERFKNLLKEHPSRAGLLIKRWIKIKSPKSSWGLSLITSRLETKELASIFKLVSEQERNEWRRLISPLNSSEESEAELFVEAQIMEELLSTSMLPLEANTLLSSLSIKDAVELSSKNLKVGVLLINSMNTQFVTSLLAGLGADTVAKLITESMKVTSEILPRLFEDIRGELEAKLQRPEKSPFIKRIAELIPTATLELEYEFWNVLVANREFAAIQEISKSYFPSLLMSQLPLPLVRQTLVAYPKAKRIEFFISQDADLRKLYIDSFCQEGSKLRELLDLDIDTIERNQILARRIKRNANEIIKDFYDFSRQLLRQNPDLQDKAQDTVISWLEELQNSVQGTKQKTKLAA